MPSFGYDSTDYVCTLSPKYLEIAEKQLNETETVRDKSIDEVRQWIRKHPHIQKCRIDANFILRFLRKTKFNVPKACRALEKYLMHFQFNAAWFQNIDLYDPKMSDLAGSGMAYFLKDRDSRGRKIIMTCHEKIDPTQLTSKDVIRYSVAMLDLISTEEESQTCGVVCIIDGKHMKYKFVRLFSMNDLRFLHKSFKDAGSLRITECYFINLPPFVMAIAKIFIMLSSEKVRKRMFFLDSQDELQKHFDLKILPKEYGGVVEKADIFEEFKKKLLGSRDSLLAFHDHIKTDFIDVKGRNAYKKSTYCEKTDLRRLNLD
jgi:hypothetical protein